MEEEFADTAEEANDVGTAESVAFLIADGFEELIDPDGGVNGEALSSECFEFDRACTGLDNGPEACDTHCGVELLARGAGRVKEDCSSWGWIGGVEGWRGMEGDGGVWKKGGGEGRREKGGGGGGSCLQPAVGSRVVRGGCGCNVAVEHKGCVSE